MKFGTFETSKALQKQINVLNKQSFVYRMNSNCTTKDTTKVTARPTSAYVKRDSVVESMTSFKDHFKLNDNTAKIKSALR